MSSKSHERPFAFFRQMWYTVRMELLQDAAMLLSFVNMKLRDRYGTLDELCDDLGLDREELERRLAEAGWSYDAKNNRFC